MWNDFVSQTIFSHDPPLDKSFAQQHPEQWRANFIADIKQSIAKGKDSMERVKKTVRTLRQNSLYP